MEAQEDKKATLSRLSCNHCAAHVMSLSPELVDSLTRWSGRESLFWQCPPTHLCSWSSGPRGFTAVSTEIEIWRNKKLENGLILGRHEKRLLGWDTHWERLSRRCSHNTSNKTRKSQNHNNSDTTTLQNSTCHFPAHTSEHVPFLDSTPLNVSDLKKPSTTPGYRDRHTSFMASTTFRQASEQTGAPLLFGLEISFSSFSSLLRSSTSQVVCPRSLRAFGSPVLIYAPLRSWNEAYDVLSRVFASGLSITQKPMVPQILCTKIVTHNPKPSLPSCRTSKRMGTFPSFSARFCNRQCRTSGDAEFSIGSLSNFDLEAHRDST